MHGAVWLLRARRAARLGWAGGGPGRAHAGGTAPVGTGTARRLTAAAAASPGAVEVVTFAPKAPPRHDGVRSVANAAALAEPRACAPPAEALALRAAREEAESRAAVVPWFVQNMPEEYFAETSETEQVRHLRALTSLHGGKLAHLLTVADEDSLTFIVPRDRPGLLAELMEHVNRSHLCRRELKSTHVHTALDGSLCLDTFRFASASEEPAALGPDGEARLAAVGLTGDEGVRVIARPADDGAFAVEVTAMSVISRLAFERFAHYLVAQGFSIEHASLTTGKRKGIVEGTESDVLLLDVTCRELADGTPASRSWDVLCQEAARAVKWVDDRTLEFASRLRDVTLTEAEVVHALCALQHPRLAGVDPHAYALSRLYELVEHKDVLPVALETARLLVSRFDPASPLDDGGYAARRDAIRTRIEAITASDAKAIAHGLLDAVDATLRTNVHVPHRLSLALRLDPGFMGHGSVGTDTPYGTFFVAGRRFRAFHVRFRDIARGGLRVVTPPKADSHAAESMRHYNEAYNLAYAQQLKNKDIPEGGSKAVILMEPDDSDAFLPDRFGTGRMVRKCVRAFSDAMLDCLLPSDSVVDRLGREETIYLGPDEQIIPEDIQWITNHAAERGYSIPNAFMSSKPEAGINHKTYGVTSEGVAVFLNVALGALRPQGDRDYFTVKLTGGTDGDVAGNMLKILHRDYGDGVRVVGICDGTATAEDPDGIPMDELLRLVEGSLPLDRLDASRLGPRGAHILADTPAGARARNTMHNRVQADAFIPAGGRPGTIDLANCEEFLSGPGGAPSSPLVVEGANLFVTPEARQELFERAGVVFVKDSSANKCGVITSSFEILASMILDTDEFVALKPTLVEDVLERLRSVARTEAELLFREYRRDPNVPIPQLSQRISAAITKAHDALLHELETSDDKATDEALLNAAATAHLPAVLATPERLVDVARRVPLPYRQNIAAAVAAATLVYEEGLVYAESVADGMHAQTARRHFTSRAVIAALADTLEAGGGQQAEAAALLRRCGARALAESGGAL